MIMRGVTVGKEELENSRRRERLKNLTLKSLPRRICVILFPIKSRLQDDIEHNELISVVYTWTSSSDIVFEASSFQLLGT